MTITDQLLLRFSVAGDAQMRNALANYNTQADKATVASQRFGRATGSNSQVAQNFGRVISDLPYGFMAISNNIEPLLFSLGASGGLTLAFTLAAAAGVVLEKSMPNLINSFFGVSKAAKAAKQEGLDGFTEAIGKLSIKNLDATLFAAKEKIREYERLLKELPNKAFETSRGKSTVSDKELDAIFNPGRMAGDKNFQASEKDLREAETRFVQKKLDAAKELFSLLQDETAKRKVLTEIMELQNSILVTNIMTVKEWKKRVGEWFDDEMGGDFGFRPKMKRGHEESVADIMRPHVQTAKEYLEMWDKTEKEKLDRRERYLQKEADRQEALLIDPLKAGFYGVARGIEDSFTKAFQNAFGEANSLLEMFALAAGQQLLFSLATSAIGGVGAGGLLGAIFPGAKGKSTGGGVGIVPSLSGGNGRPIVINLQIGRKAMRAVVSDAQSENVRLRLT